MLANIKINTLKKDNESQTQNNVKFKITSRGFPGGAVVKNLPANAGDTGSSPGPGRSHMLRSNKAPEPQLLSLRSRSLEPQLLKPMSHNY